MIVALDGTPLIVSTGGVRRYVEELSRALSLEYPHDRFDLISDQFLRPKRWIERRWWLWGVQKAMRARGVDLFHGTDFSVPYLPLKPSVVTIHDLTPWRMDASKRVRRRTPFLLRFGLTTMVITPSQIVRREVIDHFGLSPQRVVAIPLAAPPFMQPVSPGGRPRTPYFLCVATIEPRKNISMLLEAWREVRRTMQVDMVLAGRVRDGSHPPAVEPGLRFLGPVPDRELPALYSGAVACFYPSLYEGFGLPVLEAMQCGAAVVTSRDPAVMETGGEAAIAIDAGDTKAWAEIMRHLLATPELVAERRELSLLRAAEFTWSRTARETYEVYCAALRLFQHA